MGPPCRLEIRFGPYLMFVLMFDTTYMVDEMMRYCCYWLWFELMNCWFLMLLQPMLFINIIAIYSYRTFTRSMLVKLHEEGFWERKKYYNKCKEKGSSSAILHANNWKEMRNNCKGEEFKASLNYTTCMRRLNDYY